MTHRPHRLLAAARLLTPLLLAPGPTLLIHLAPARAHMTARPPTTAAPAPAVAAELLAVDLTRRSTLPVAPLGWAAALATSVKVARAAPAAEAGPVARAAPVAEAGPVARAAPVAGGGPMRWAAPVGSTWRWPLAGRPVVTRRFDPPATRYGSGHRGVDLAGQPGQPVLAAGAGVVVYARLLAGRGVVSVEHDGGLRTTYEPVRATVTAGQRVAAGATIGRLDPGHAGCPAAACLHWGLRRGDTYLDPLRLLAGPVRLLPLDGPGGSDPTPASTPAGSGSAGRPATAGRRGSLDGDGGAGSTPADLPTRLGAGAATVAGAALGGTLLLRRRGP
jgi:murein DD-endopeptidase MepM/ murein hydrolase activator NlpD